MDSDPGRAWIDSLPGLGLVVGTSLGVVVSLLVADGFGIPIGIAIGASLGLTAGAAWRAFLDPR